MARSLTLLIALVSTLGLEACRPGPSPYELEVLQHRFDKNVALADSTGSPLLEDDRIGFAGLVYFEVDSAYHFVLPLIPPDSAEIVQIQMQTGGTSPYLRQGLVEIPFPERTCSLSVFLPLMGPKRSWIPFTDLTSGGETYGGGRYLDVEIINDMVVVDFNYAYNPFCAYNPNFVCGLPPSENALPLPVHAGEKIPEF